MKTRFGVFVAIACVMSACGGGNKNNSSSSGETGGAAPAPDPVTNYQGGSACGSKVVSDYNTFALNCSVGAICADCTSSANSFLAKYPNSNCTAAKTSSSSVDSTTLTITPDYVKQQVSGVGCTIVK